MNEVKKECCICLEKKPEVVTECKHQFCKECITTWYKRHISCPLCRVNIENKIYNIIM